MAEKELATETKIRNAEKILGIIKCVIKIKNIEEKFKIFKNKSERTSCLHKLWYDKAEAKIPRQKKEEKKNKENKIKVNFRKLFINETVYK